ncbi:MAG TPA: hypothetical protein VGC41_08640 [Kofleriaceae bacterium]
MSEIIEWVLGFVAVVIAACAVRFSQDGDSVMVIACAILSPCLLGAAIFVRHQKTARHAFFDFLRKNRASIVAGTATWAGHPITYATQVQTFSFVLSVGMGSFKLQTAPKIVGAPGTLSMRVGATATTLLLGWWSIPAGPVWTVSSVISNLRSAKAVSIGELYEGKSNVQMPAARIRN